MKEGLQSRTEEGVQQQWNRSESVVERGVEQRAESHQPRYLGRANECRAEYQATTYYFMHSGPGSIGILLVAYVIMCPRQYEV